MYQFWKGKIEQLEAENERLRALVAHLPRTKDGVEVVPGRDYWCRYKGSDDDECQVKKCRYVGHAGPHMDYDYEVSGWPYENDTECEVFEVYSTKQAATAAGGERDV